jgi:TatD DNase family protein
MVDETQGVHPHDAKSWDDETFESLQELAKNQECVAIGECGLDFNRNFSEPRVQLEVFEKQVRQFKNQEYRLKL